MGRHPRWSQLIVVLLFLVFWELAARFWVDKMFLSPPSRVYGEIGRVFSTRGVPEALGITLLELGVAFTLAVMAGLVVGLAVGLGNFARRSFMPIILLLYAIPQVSLLPLVILTFGLGPAAKIAFGFSHGVFPIIMNVVAGMRDVKELHLRAARSMGASRMDTIRHVILPHAVPSLFTGLRLGMTLTLLGVILAELYVSTGGIGYFTRVFAESYDPAPLFALTGCLAIIAVLFNELVRLAQNKLTPGKRRPPTLKNSVKE
jgi:NitT/TauT family transport system permease protein